MLLQRAYLSVSKVTLSIFIVIKIVKTILITYAVTISAEPIVSDYDKLTNKQKSILEMAYNYGKEFDLGYTLAAIAWQESFVGNKIVPINLQDPSAGLWHMNIFLALTQRPEIPQNSLQLNIMADRLINNTDFAASLSIADLEYWKLLRKGNWLEIWASYNAGKYYQSTLGNKYAKSIQNKIRTLKHIFPVDSKKLKMDKKNHHK